MILKLRKRDVKASGARGEVDGKNVNFNMLVEVDELTIQEAITEYDSFRGVVGFLFTGEPSFLKTIEYGVKPVIITKEVEKLDMNVDFLMSELDKRARVVFNLPKEYNNMQEVYTYCQKYPNLRVDGGKFLRLEGCNIGLISREDIPKKIADSRIPIVAETEGSVQAIIDIDDVTSVEFFENKKTVKKRKNTTTGKAKTKRKSKPKKQLSSLLSLSGGGSMDNF